MGEIHHQGEVAALAFVQAECGDELREHLRGQRLAAADQVEVEPRRGIPGLLREGPVREVALHGLTVLIVVLQVLPIVVIGVDVH